MRRGPIRGKKGRMEQDRLRATDSESRLLSSSLAVSADSSMALGTSFCATTTAVSTRVRCVTVGFWWFSETPWPHDATGASGGGRKVVVGVVVVLVDVLLLLDRLALRLRPPCVDGPLLLKFLRCGFLMVCSRGGSVPRGAQMADSVSVCVTFGA